MNMEAQVPTEEEVKRKLRSSTLLFFALYLVQKASNNLEGLSKTPFRNLLKKPVNEGGLGLNAEQAGAFSTDASVGWFVKALFGPITDGLPIMGYRRKSWLMISSLAAGGAWFYLATGDTTSKAAVFAGIVIVNLFISFSDVVTDGLMVQTAQEFDAKYRLKPGTTNRPLQAAQWQGALVAILIASLAGGVIAQHFNFKTAAVISGLFPLGLFFLIAFFVKEEKVAWDATRAKRGFVAAAVTVVVALLILWLKKLPEESALKPWEPYLSPLIVLAALMLFVRIPTKLLGAVALIFFWQSTPFNVDSTTAYRYMTEDNSAFVQALNSDGGIVSGTQDLLISLQLATADSVKSGFQEIFVGSVLGPVNIIFSIIGLVWFSRRKDIPLSKMFAICVGGNGLAILMFLCYPALGLTSAGYMILINAVAGFFGMVAVMSILSYAAANTPHHDQATTFAFFMGLSNLGQMLGVETAGSKIYMSLGMTTHEGMIGLIIVSLAHLALLFVFVATVTFLVQKWISKEQRKTRLESIQRLLRNIWFQKFI